MLINSSLLGLLILDNIFEELSKNWEFFGIFLRVYLDKIIEYLPIEFFRTFLFFRANCYPCYVYVCMVCLDYLFYRWRWRGVL